MPDQLRRAGVVTGPAPNLERHRLDAAVRVEFTARRERPYVPQTVRRVDVREAAFIISSTYGGHDVIRRIKIPGAVVAEAPVLETGRSDNVHAHPVRGLAGA